MLSFESSAIEFIWPWSSLFLLLPILARLISPSESLIQALRIPFFNRINNLTQTNISKNKITKTMIFSGIIWFFLVIASMRPQWVGNPIELPVSGRSVMLAVDLSGSMKENDMELNGEFVTRLEVVKSVLRQFILRRKGDRLGLILFGSQAYLQTPLTFDLKTLEHMLEESELGLAGERTSIGNAIGLAIKRMKDLPDKEKVLILLTDGQNTAGEVSPEDAGLAAKETKIKIHTIGVGADEAWVRTFFGKQKVNPSAELDESMLQFLANMTGGSYFRARSSEELEKIYSMINEIEPVEKEKKLYRPRQSLFFWPLGFAISVIGLWFTILLYRSK